MFMLRAKHRGSLFQMICRSSRNSLVKDSTSFGAGYLTAGLWTGIRDAAPLARICAQVDYVNDLQKAESKEARYEFRTLVEQYHRRTGQGLRLVPSGNLLRHYAGAALYLVLPRSALA